MRSVVMKKYYLDMALKAAREMIQAYYVDRNVEGVFKHLSEENFSFMGFIEGNFFNSKEAFKEYAEVSLPNTLNYKMVDENYSVGGQSQDSCLVIAKISFVYTRTQKPFVLNFFFYFNLRGGEIICTHYHVSRTFAINLLEIANLTLDTDRISLKKKTADLVRADYGINISQNVIIYPRSRKVKIEGESIDLTPLELEIFLVLADNLNRPIMPEKIYASIWTNSELQMTSNVLPMHISNIRRKLSPYEDLIQLLYIRDKGYCLSFKPKSFS